MEESPVDDNKQEGPSLPIDFIIYIVEFLLPERDSAVLLPSDQVTKTLLSMRTLCKAINSRMVPLLLQHCMYIDSKEKALQLATQLEHMDMPPGLSTDFNSLFADFMVTENLVLSFFHPLHFTLESASEYEETAYSVRSILLAVGPMLRTLVVNMVFPTFHPDYPDCNVGRILRVGFEALVNLEEFCNTLHESSINFFPRDGHVWTLWPNLRRLQLLNANPLPKGANNLWLNFARMPCLETVMLVHTGRKTMHNVNVKGKWLNAVNRAAREQRGTPYIPRSTDITFILANFGSDQPCYNKFRRSWQKRDPEGNVRVLTRKVPSGRCHKCGKLPTEAAFIVQKRILDWACQGVLWDDDVRGVKDIMTKKTKKTKKKKEDVA